MADLVGHDLAAQVPEVTLPEEVKSGEADLNCNYSFIFGVLR